MNPVSVAAAGGATAAAGLLLLFRHTRPQPILLQQLLAPPAARPAGRNTPSPANPGIPGRVAGWLSAHPIGPAPAAADLAILDVDPAAHALRKAAMAAFGLLLPSVTAGLLTIAGHRIPFTVPAGVGLLLAAVFYLAPDWVLRGQAQEARTTFSAVVGSYLDLVALERTADGAPAETLYRAAQVAESWPFRRIRTALDRARLAGIPPWEALADLADDLAVDDLRDLADILSAAGDDGAAVYTALTAKAAALRTRQQAAAKAAANTASERLTLPAVLLSFGFLLLVCYPAIARVLGL